MVSDVDGQPTLPHDFHLAERPLRTPGADGNAYQVVAVCVFLLAAVGLVFGQTVRFQFINLDDTADVYLNPHVTAGLAAKEVKWAFTERDAGTWMPLTAISHMLDCQLYGLEAGGHHLTNVLLHAASAVLLFLVLRQLTGRLWPSALVAAVFAVHPLRVESVAWVTERKDCLSGLFFMLALWAYVGYARRPFSLVRYLAVMVLLAWGLMAKPMLVTLPFVFLLLDYWPLGRFALPEAEAAPVVSKKHLGVAARLVLEKVPLLALSVLSTVVATWAYGSEGGELLDQRCALLWRIAVAPISCVTYLGMFFYPANLATPYPRPGDLPVWEVLAAVLALVALTTAAVLARRRCPYLLVGWLWYVGMLVPVSGVLQFGAQTLADRFTYLPQIGLCLALVWGWADLSRSWPLRRQVCGALAAIVVAVLIVCAWRQTSFWRDNVTLWNHTLACTSRNRLAHHALGNTFLELGQPEKAIEQYQAALALEPDAAASAHNLGAAPAAGGAMGGVIRPQQSVAVIKGDFAETHYNLGVALAAVGRFDEAIEQYEKTVELKPNHAVAHNNLGHALLVRGQLDGALSHCREALQLDPHFAEAHYNMGSIRYLRGEVDAAIEEYRQAVAERPDFNTARYCLGLAYARGGQLDEAIAEYHKTLETNPDFAAEVYNALGLALAARGKPAEAATEYRKALALQPDFAEARYNLNRVSSAGAGIGAAP